MNEFHVPPPTVEESMELAGEYMQIAMHAADGDADSVSDLIEKFLSHEDQQVESFRLFAFAAIGPVLAAAALQKLVGAASGEQWILEQVGPVNADEDPDQLAAMQAICFQLNDDQDGSHDVMDAHFNAARHANGWAKAHEAHEAMFSMCLFQLTVLVRAIQCGAFGPRDNAA